MNILIAKFKEVLSAVFQITIIVLMLNFTIVPLDTPLIIRFLVGAFLITLGLSIFLFGVDIGVATIGTLMGSTLAKTNKIWIISMAGLILGFFISISEPDLHIFAGQVNFVTSGSISKFSIIIIVSIGIAVMVSLGLARIVYNIPLYKMLTLLYLLILILAIFTSSEFLAISFDASGATTGAITVPFILALTLGVSALKKDSKASEEDSFGLIAIASSGAIMSVMIMGIFSKTDKINVSLECSICDSTSIIAPFIQKIPTIIGKVFLALLPLLMIFLVFQKISFKLTKKAFRKVSIGLGYTFTGLILFLIGVNAGFMDVGTVVGYNIASLENKFFVIIVGFILGFVTILG